MRLVCVNKALDSDEVPDEVVDMVLLKRLAMVRQGFTGDYKRMEANADAIVRELPEYDGVAEWLGEHQLSF